MKKILLCIAFFLPGMLLYGQTSSLIVLGDIHYDLLNDHDMEWLKTKPDDFRQVNEYTQYTKNNWADFMTVIKAKALTENPPVHAVIQTGDLSEGLAGSEKLARQMSANVMKAIQDINMPVPWILTKGNHDITGPGAKEAFNEFYLPTIRKQTNNCSISGGSYSYSFNNVKIVVADPYDKNTDLVNFIDEELSNSDATVKFVAVHEPIIPVTERCWHILRKNAEQREKLLETIAKNKAIVLCGHLHRYSVVRRMTNFGPIVQLMVVSVVQDRSYQFPEKMITQYGPSIADAIPQWQPETLEARKALLEEEAKFVTFYKQTDVPGYALLKIDGQKRTVDLEYFAAFNSKPFDKINLSELLKN